MTGGEPTRRCVGCGRTAPRRSLQRYVVRDGALVVDPAGRLSGRGAYTHRAPDCYELARTRGGFNRAFRRAVRAPAAPPAWAAPDAPPPSPRRQAAQLDSSENVHLDTA
ncbi:DUF448 domain-containing protein [Conexibacter arvalis]|uniref:DUF448 domain-containing protein n=1 Tax=Conexibacter arvalis TaxID=912552 RepID=UPI0016131B27